jgi:hypothetical protein
MMPARRRSMAELLKEQRAIDDAGPPLAAVPAPAAAGTPAVLPVSAIPAPHSPAGHGQLTPEEEADLATCEVALDNLRLAFAAAGKALQVILDGRLYRSTHDTF